MAERQDPAGCAGNTMGRIGTRPYWVLNLSVVIRAAHQVGAAVFLATYLVDGIAHPPSLYLVLVYASGAILLFTEWMRHRQLYRELCGVATAGKLLLLGAAYHGFLAAPIAVLLAFVLASVAAHVPKMLRHRLLF